MRAYWDTSALAALYLPEIHSARAAAALREHKGQVLLTELQEMELCNAMQLRVFRREFDAATVASGQAGLAEDCRRGIYLRTPLPASVFASAKRLALERTARLGIHSLDLLHVAAAIDLHADVFVSFDKRQRTLARSLDLQVS